MSRVGRRAIAIPEGTTVTVTGSLVEVKGKMGELSRKFSPLIAVEVRNNEVLTLRANEEKHTKQLHGTTNSLINSMVEGVTKGFKKQIVINGVGYKSSIKNNQVEIFAGYSHPHYIDIIEGVKVECVKPTQITITGPDKQKVGQQAAWIRDVRRPNPYSGKGIMYKDEVIIRKEGKAASK